MRLRFAGQKRNQPGKNQKNGIGFKESIGFEELKDTQTLLSAEAAEDQDISQPFANSESAMRPVQRVNVDFSASMLEELDSAATELNMSRQAVIKTLVRHALDHRYLARRVRDNQETA